MKTITPLRIGSPDDKNTTGLLVVAKTAESAASPQNFQPYSNKAVHRVGLGNIEEEAGRIEAHVGRHQRFRKMFDAYPKVIMASMLLRIIRLLERLNYVTLVECVLKPVVRTRYAFIMKHIGHTLFNDWEYGGDKILKGTIYSKYKQFVVDNCFDLCPRCALHARTLGFKHPVTGKEIFFESPFTR